MTNKIDLETLRHSTSHIMAQAVQELFPGAKLGIGPAIDDGFYYDFDLPAGRQGMPQQLTPEDLPKIEKKMKEIIKANHKFDRIEMKKDEAIKLMEEKGEKYKVELLNDLEADKVSLYKNGDFMDLCRGPHIEKTGQIKAFKVLSIAGAYWHGLEGNPMLQRIYGTTFHSKDELNQYLKNLEEAKKRDHRKLGKELDLFSFHEEAGAGFVYYHPKGAIVRNLIEQFMREENEKRDYQPVVIPHIAKINLWNTSGHTNYYKENMYFMQIDEQDYVIKPMNCPGHILIYKRKLNSYRDLPVRFYEMGTVYRYEKSGVLHGLTRVRGFTQDDAHIFCPLEQLDKEIETTVKFAIKILKTFGFKEYDIYLSTQPEKFVGTQASWKKSTSALEKSLKKLKIKYEIDPAGGVFYGPKIDIKIKDSLGRDWQCTTIQVDFNLPEKFDVTYIDNKGKKQQPIMIHRALLGSLERFLGILIEHYAGDFPVWLSPIQVYLTPVGQAHSSLAKKLSQELEELGIKTEVDTLNETISYKVRKAEKQKIPYILVIGDKEAKGKILNVRMKGNVVKKMTKKQFCDKILKEIKDKK